MHIVSYLKSLTKRSNLFECCRSLQVNIVAMPIETEVFFLNGRVDIVLNDLNPQN